MEEKKIRKVFLDELPRYIEGRCKGKINWNLSVGCKINFTYDEIEGWIEIISFYHKNRRCTVKYSDNIFEIDASNICNCKITKILGKRTSEFKIKKGQNFKDNKRDITIIDMEYRLTYNKDRSLRQNEKYYKYKCNKCGWTEGWMREASLINSANGCSCCSGNTLVQGINDISTTNPEMVKYFQGGIEEASLYTKAGGGNPNNKKGKIYPLCPDCRRVRDKLVEINNIYKTHSIGCFCGDKISYPNKFAFEMLKQINIVFETEYSPDWIGKRRYDFYIPSINKIIEMDGGWHNKDNNLSNQTKEESKAIDDYKDEQARLHGIEVIRIDCEISNIKFIINNILSKLNNVINLSKVNWNKCDKFACSNLVKMACELKKNNSELTTTEISKLMNDFNTSTIVRWLNRGQELGFCKYSGEIEKKKMSIKRSKQLCIFLNNDLLGIFKSTMELERQSEELFGVKLNSKNISTVCLGKVKTHHKFKFKYVSDLTDEEKQLYNII
jgi:very-short-patch-repair endonuclease